MIGTLVGNGQCVTFVHAAIATPPSSLWKAGIKVKGNFLLKPGTVIAVFDDNGRYGNHTNGSSHAAIYLSQTAAGIQVLDQWNGHTAQPVHQRTIRFRAGHGVKVNDGDQFSVVE
ncbi:BPSL0067 family protein [Acetobacter sacchari]|uniref:BPSL0067 family protein n=1 Tax=Acetobacter sacchari TaxID=2661687 RepID=A0ABS3LYP7_9PROT|nr:BPSL0067 family protein [Acetobacter sacchari]MBO1361026.1 BPSL0067 family protein [Acetobacter sacchari]